MRHVLLTLLVLSSPAFAQTEGSCSGNMLEINDCMAAGLERVEAELNDMYARVMKDLSAPDEPLVPRAKSRTELRDAQRAWIAFRKKNCDAIYTLNSGGSIRNMRYIACMRRHAEARTSELKDEYVRE